MAAKKPFDVVVKEAVERLKKDPSFFRLLRKEIRREALLNPEVLESLKNAGEVPKNFEPTEENINKLDKLIEEEKIKGTGIGALYNAEMVCPKCGHKGMNIRLHSVAADEPEQEIPQCPRCKYTGRRDLGVY